MSRSFTYRLEGDIKRYMNGQPDKEETAGTVYNASLPFLKADECERVKGQLSDIVQNMKEERQQSRSRDFICKTTYQHNPADNYCRLDCN